jgi:ribosomal protein S18 acetylase RimI-like enzyme
MGVMMAQYHGSPSIDFAVHPDNHAARALYASLGFAPTETRENFFGDGEPRLIMQLVRNATARDGS